MPPYPTPQVMTLIRQACQKANLDPEIPRDLKQLVSVINQGLPAHERIGHDYIYKKIYSEREKSSLGLNTQYLNLIARFLNFESFTAFTHALSTEEREDSTANTDHLKGETPAQSNQGIQLGNHNQQVIGGSGHTFNFGD